MVPDKFNMVDMGGIDLIMMQGEAVPGLYDRLMAAISNCQYQCLYNWLFDGVLIPPSYVQLTDIDGEVYLNEGVSVSSDDVIHIYSVEPGPSDPEIVPLLAEENGVYTVPADVDGFNPVTVDVPPPQPVIAPITIDANGVYPITGSIDGYGPITVDVPGGEEPEPSLPEEYQEVEYIDFDGSSYVTIDSQKIEKNDVVDTFGQYTTAGDGQTLIGVTSPGSTERFQLYFTAGQARAFLSGNAVGRAAIDVLSNPGTSVTSVNTAVSIGDKKYFMMELYSWTALTKYLQIGAYGSNVFYKSRLFKIRHRRRIDAVGNPATGSFGTYRYELFTWYKPCYRKADNVPGWYDTSAGIFYTNQGNGTFVVGPDIN